jgi:hypothetical protein
VNDRLSTLESRVDQLARQVSDIERRISALDRSEVAPETPAVAPIAPETDLGVVFSFVGRTLLALGGAYLLRALTEAGALPQIAGVSLAAAYAAGWIFLAERAGAAGKSTSAAFHLGAAALVGYPLLWETTARLHLLAPSASASALVALTVAILAVASRRELEPGAWAGVIAATLAAVALLLGTRAVAPFSGALVVSGLATLVLWGSKNSPLTWVSAGVADLAVVVLTIGAVIQSAGFSIAAALTVQLALFLGYVGIFFRRNVVEGKEATVFELAQGGVATLIGVGGAAAIAHTPPALAAVLLVGLAAASVCYRSTVRLLSRVEGRNAIFYSSLALAMVLLATGASIPHPEWVWATLAVLSFALGKRLPAIALSLHGSLYLLAAAAASGLVKFSAWAFAAPVTMSWPALPSSSLPVIGAGIAASLLGVPEAPGWRTWARLPPALALGVTLLGVSAGALILLSPVAGADAARLAALRTAILALAAVALAAVSNRTRLIEARWLSTTILVLGGMKLAVEDFPRGRPTTLFLALGFYGVALILASRLARRAR